MLVIGLAGGIASGKSFVAGCFESLGAKRIDADKLGHQVLDEPSVRAAIEARWGSGVISDEKVNRQRLGEIVFHPDASEQELTALEGITHPRIHELVNEQLDSFRGDSRTPAVVLDAPVMFRAGWSDHCDRIVFVDARLETRKQRAAARGWDEDELESRESRQMKVEMKKWLSTDVIDNSLSERNTRDQVRRLWLQWELPLPS